MAQNLDRNTAEIVSETAIFCLVLFLSLVGNLLVCYAVYKNPRLRCPSNYYIISLAFSDIFQALCTMPLSIAMLATGVWPFGTSACYFMAISKYALAKISIYTMVLMALNRYYKIVKPAKYQTTFKKRFIIVTASLVWVLSILYTVLITFFLGSDHAKPNPYFALCAVQYRSFGLPVLTVAMYLPYIIIIFCYWKIHRVVKLHNASVSWQSSNVEDVKISKTLFVTVIAFVVLWLPAHSIYLASIPFSLPRQLTLFGTFLVFSSSCVNPFIYGFMNRSFKNEFKKCLKLRKTQTIGTESS
ncbi:histamine H2 receptor-like [Oculina patagonica]